MKRKNKVLHHNYRFINVHPIAGALGAEIKGVNIALPLKREVVLEIRQAFLDHLVIFFHNQELTPQEQLAFSRQFGKSMEYYVIDVNRCKCWWVGGGSNPGPPD